MNSRQCSVEPSPTPMIPILEEEIIVISEFSNALRSIKAETKPAVPEPTMQNDKLLFMRLSLCYFSLQFKTIQQFLFLRE